MCESVVGCTDSGAIGLDSACEKSVGRCLDAAEAVLTGPGYVDSASVAFVRRCDREGSDDSVITVCDPC